MELKCSECGGEVIKNNKYYKCSKCGRKISFSNKGKHVDMSNLNEYAQVLVEG